ncbi:tRNA(Arg) A34 adenosine deaminase TadA [Afipia massiliensis]|uniref:tRNA(Arg) A34 adenosine deaminase TadA n=1 Tax=Afipia massiliensis TaxID=211460 RepID=A0A840N7B6_9BRAD|nr:nucleoside deaminase [Afipia massiliensis]MBB5054742.1 tRNA(Arg) A34 adenosine deaminase TadA [Afipia massiliensis]
MDSRTEDNETPLDTLFASARIVHRRNFLTTGAAALMAAAGSDVAFAKEAPKQAANDQERKFMSHAVELMRKAGVVEKTGGPFGAVVVMNNEILSSSGNSVLRDNDPSAHAEVNAIRMACKKVGSPHIKGATLFSSCEPCPMCYSTAYWARVDKIYYAASWSDYADLFDDSNINQDMKQSYAKRTVRVAQLMRGDAQKVWLEYRNLPNKTRY